MNVMEPGAPTRCPECGRELMLTFGEGEGTR